jgi:Txe/YoeB family toxin of Txe-Axe toxin-antitoxin module
LKTVSWTNLANETYSDIDFYLENEFGENLSKKFFKTVLKLINNITNNNFLCPPTKFSTNYRKCTISEQCCMIYRIDENIIEIITFIDNRSDHQY